jgi:hypothetical protein
MWDVLAIIVLLGGVAFAIYRAGYKSKKGEDDDLYRKQTGNINEAHKEIDARHENFGDGGGHPNFDNKMLSFWNRKRSVSSDRSPRKTTTGKP